MSIVRYILVDVLIVAILFIAVFVTKDFTDPSTPVGAISIVTFMYLLYNFVFFSLMLIMIALFPSTLKRKIVFDKSQASLSVWRDVYNLETYLRVSGMDTFNPKLDSMDFDGIDKLYPYAVAAGLDKQFVKKMRSKITNYI